MRFDVATKTASLLLLLILPLGSCTSPTEAPHSSTRPDEVRGISLKADFDEATGTVSLPYDRLSLSPPEEELLTKAGSVATSVCAQSQGVHFVPSRPKLDPVYESEQYLGPWTVDQAQRFGFVTPMTEADLEANGILPPPAEREGGGQAANPNSRLTDSDWAVVNKCATGGSLDEFTSALEDVGPWVAPMRSIDESLPRDPQARALIAKLDSCFAGMGLVPSADMAWLPEGANGHEITEEQISLALSAVECKNRVNFTLLMADREAELQAPIIEKYAAELAERRASIEKAVADARELIAKNDDLFVATE